MLLDLGIHMGNSRGMPLYFEASRYLIGEMTKAAEATNHNVKNGLIVTGDSFINDGRKSTKKS